MRPGQAAVPAGADGLPDPPSRAWLSLPAGRRARPLLGSRRAPDRLLLNPRRPGRSRGLQWSRSQERERRGLERLNVARPGSLAPEPGEPPGDEAEARRKAAETAAHPGELPRPLLVAGPGQEELGPGGEARDKLRAAGVGGHPRSLQGWGRDPACRPPPHPQP